MKQIIYLTGFITLFFFTGCEFMEEDSYRTANDMLGEYEVDEWSETLGAQSYFDMYVTGDKRNHDIVYFENFYNADMTVYVEVNGSKLRIPNQEVGFYEIEGMGSYYDGELTITYSVTDINGFSDIVDICNAICYQK
ncbi:hypothetical protein ACFLU5_10270 [Bacteroidota bacterium]